ncbi:hypothetical protein E4K10_33160 [Streptomyces sp. T1317-0309]|nr:hypothetical protein E4K10_33160 [Streptomyces sp. T1317-0309]
MHGKRPFGYARRYEVIDGRSRPVEQYPDADEAPLVVELFERVAGWNGRKRESIRSIALDWERRGIVSREKGVPISANNLRPMLLRKAYIGVRVHGTSERPGNWEPLIDSDLFDAVQAVLADPSRKSHTTTSVRHVLTGTLRCDVCGNGMTLTPGDRPGKEGKRHGRAACICRKYSHTRIDKADTDALLIGTAERPGTLLAYLSGRTCPRRWSTAATTTPSCPPSAPDSALHAPSWRRSRARTRRLLPRPG